MILFLLTLEGDMGKLLVHRILPLLFPRGEEVPHFSIANQERVVAMGPPGSLTMDVVVSR